MMFRLVRFLILTLTLGRIKWLMRLTWVWRLIVFLGLTGWLSKKLRRAVGLDKSSTKGDVDSAWAEALRYSPTPGTVSASAGAAPGAGMAYSPPFAKESAVGGPVSESTSEVTGFTADGTSETITIHEVSAEGQTETVVRIADDDGNVETVVTGSSVEEIDLAHLGTSPTEAEPAIDEIAELEVEAEIEEIVAEEIEAEAEIDEILDVLEAAESEVEEDEIVEVEVVDLEQPQAERTAMPEEPLEITDEDPDPDILIEPDWVRGDGTHDCPDSHPIKAKASSMIYYVPESGHYDRTIPDVCFAGPEDAEAAGYRAPRR